MIMFDPISTCRSKLEFPAAASAVDGELWSWISGAWGVAPVDGLSATPSSHPCGWVSTATFKALWRLGSSWSVEDGETAMNSFDGFQRRPWDSWSGGLQKVLGSFLYFCCLWGAYLQITCGLYPSRMYLYLFGSVYDFLNMNTGMFASKKKTCQYFGFIDTLFYLYYEFLHFHGTWISLSRNATLHICT